MLFFPAKTACHDTPHNKFDMYTKRVEIIPTIRLKFNKILIIISIKRIFYVWLQYHGILGMAIKKSLHLTRSFVNIIFTFFQIYHFVIL